MNHSRRLTFAVGTGLLSASLATGSVGCDKNHPVNVHPGAEGGVDPGGEGADDSAAPEQPEEDTDNEQHEAPEEPSGPNVNVVPRG